MSRCGRKRRAKPRDKTPSPTATKTGRNCSNRPPQPPRRRPTSKPGCSGATCRRQCRRICSKAATAAKAAAGSIGALNNAEAVLNAGTLVGPTAQAQRCSGTRPAALAGNEDSQRLVANTQTFQATLGPAVMAAVKAYGGPQVSNTDREYAAAMVGSDIALSEPAIRRIIDIGKRSAQAAMAEHRSKAEEHAKDAPALRKFLEVSDPLAASPSLSETTKPAGPAPRSFASEAEAEASGLPKGTPVIINGRRGRIN